MLGVIVLNYKLPVEARLAIFIDFKQGIKFLQVIKLTEDVEVNMASLAKVSSSWFNEAVISMSKQAGLPLCVYPRPALSLSQFWRPRKFVYTIFV